MILCRRFHRHGRVFTAIATRVIVSSNHILLKKNFTADRALWMLIEPFFDACLVKLMLTQVRGVRKFVVGLILGETNRAHVLVDILVLFVCFRSSLLDIFVMRRALWNEILSKKVLFDELPSSRWIRKESLLLSVQSFFL